MVAVELGNAETKFRQLKENIVGQTEHLKLEHNACEGTQMGDLKP